MARKTPATKNFLRVGQQKTAAVRKRQRDRTKDRKRKLEHAAAEQTRRQATGSKPAITASLASEYAKLLMSGVPPLLALRYLAPQAYAAANETTLEQWLREWAGSPLVFAAVNALNSGEWHHLTPERRLQLAMDKHLAELAHFLYVHPYEDLMGIDLTKANTAADRLSKHLDGGDGDGHAPWQEFVRDMLKEMDKPGAAAVPLVVPSLSLDRES